MMDDTETKAARPRALRLMGKCAVCGARENLRPDGSLVKHGDATFRSYWGRPNCRGAGHQPVDGSVAEWLASQRKDAEATIAETPKRRGKADEEYAAALAQIRRWETDAREKLKAIEKAEKSLAKRSVR